MSESEKVGSKLRMNMRLSVVEGLFAMPLVFFAMPGNFLMASLATEALSLNERVYGVIASLPAWANVGQLFALPWLARKLSPKVICLLFSWIHMACWVVVGYALPKLVAGGPWHSNALILGLFAAGSLAFALVNVSWTSWVQEWLPKYSRGKYLGRRNRLLQIVTVLFLLFASAFLASWRESIVYGFQLIIFFSVGMRAVSIVLQLRILPVKAVPDERGESPWAQMASIVRNRPFLRFVWFGATFGFMANVVGPFFPVFFFKALGMSVDEVARLAIVSTTTGALALPFWGRICDRYGCRPTILMSLAVWIGVGYFYLLASPDRTWVLFPIWGVGGAAAAGFLFGTFNMTLKLIPAKAKTAAISFNLAASSLAAAVAPILGGFLFDWVETNFGDLLTAFHALSVAHTTLVLATGFILLGVAEPKAATLTQVIGAMRPMRHIGAALGLSFLGNYSFFRKPGRKKSSSNEPQGID